MPYSVEEISNRREELEASYLRLAQRLELANSMPKNTFHDSVAREDAITECGRRLEDLKWKMRFIITLEKEAEQRATT